MIYWLRGYGGAVFLIAGLMVFGIPALMFLNRPYSTPAVLEEAEVVRFGARHVEEGSRPLVIVKTKDGRIRQLLANPRQLLHCRRGTTILLERRGTIFLVHPRGCVPQGPRGEDG